MIAENGNIRCWYSTRTVSTEDQESGQITEHTIPDRYYADEDCKIPLDNSSGRIIPAFINSSYDVTAEKDPNLPYIGLGNSDIYSGLETIGVQSNNDSDDVRILTVADSRILRDAADFGYLFEIIPQGSSNDKELTVTNAPFRYSCKSSANDMKNEYGYCDNKELNSTDYKYVTARVVRSSEKEYVRARFYVLLENGKDYIYSAVTDSTPTLKSSDYMSSISDNLIFDAARDPIFISHSLLLNDSIGLNYYLDVPDDMVNSGKVKVDFAWTVGDSQKKYSVTLTSADKEPGGYLASCPVVVAEMVCDVTASVTIDGIVQDETNTFSAVQYADYILTNNDFITAYKNKNSEEKYQRLSTLIKSMLDYGAKAQIQFGREENNLADKKFVTDDQDSPYYYNPANADLSNISTGAGDMKAGLESWGLEYKGSSIVYLSETSIRHYYDVINRDLFNAVKDNIEFSGEKVGYTDKDGLIYFELKNISAADLDKLYTLKIGENMYEYSVLDYVKACMNSDSVSTDMKALAKATYYYNQAAKNYFER